MERSPNKRTARFDCIRIRQIREQRKYTQAEVAKFLAMGQSSYNDIEQGRTSPKAETIHKLADFFDVDIRCFYETDLPHGGQVSLVEEKKGLERQCQDLAKKNEQLTRLLEEQRQMYLDIQKSSGELLEDARARIKSQRFYINILLVFALAVLYIYTSSLSTPTISWRGIVHVNGIAAAGRHGLRQVQHIVAHRRARTAVQQTDLASQLGIHKNVLARYERNEVFPSIDIAHKIADILEVSLDYLTAAVSWRCRGSRRPTGNISFPSLAPLSPKGRSRASYKHTEAQRLCWASVFAST